MPRPGVVSPTPISPGDPAGATNTAVIAAKQTTTKGRHDMGKASATKGSRGEREAAELLTTALGYPVRRALGAGRSDDVGDLDGVEGFAIQVANRRDLADTIRNKPLDAALQAANRGVPFGVALVKLPPRPGGKPAEWRVVMTVETFAAIHGTLVDLDCPFET